MSAGAADGGAPLRTVLSWSGGKDSAMVAHALRADSIVELAGLLTTVTAGYDRVSIHGVRRALLEMQAERLGLPLAVAEIVPEASNAIYEASFRGALERERTAGVRRVAYGDLRLRDVREYRERLTAEAGLEPTFPVWGRDTGSFARNVIRLGFRAVLVCVDSDVLDGALAGREYDASLLDDLPPGVDPCGENGEFHTFVYDGPGFSTAVPFRRGERVVRDRRFVFRDLMPV